MRPIMSRTSIADWRRSAMIASRSVGTPYSATTRRSSSSPARSDAT